MNLIDVHAHLDDGKFNGETEEILERASENGITKIICVGASLFSSERASEIAKASPMVYATVGVHPEYCDEFDEKTLEKLEKIAKNNEKVVAIGEIGLDYHYEGYNKDKQKEVFLSQLKLANSLGLPVQIHSRDATEDLIDILENNKQLLSFGGIVHCFSGSKETYQIIHDLGLGISVGGVITFKNARSIIEVLSVADKNDVMIETDCPYLSPEPKRGQRNESANVLYVAKRLAVIWGLSEEEVCEITTANAKRIFKRLV